MKNTKKVERIIFSNVNQGENCFDGCLMDDSCDCESIAIDDERINLNIETENEIIAIADLGLWNGRVMGYKELGNNISNILYSNCETVKWYSDGKNICGTFSHHDGTNYITYREMRKGKNIEKLKELIYNEEATPETINKFTKSIVKYVNKVYGW